MTHRTLVVTGCDAAHHGLAGELLESLHDLPSRSFDIGFVQLGPAPLPYDIRAGVDLVASVDDTAFRQAGGGGYALAYLAVKPRLPAYFPGYDTYVWMDGDTWVQDGAGIEDYVRAAETADIAIHPECDLNYVAELRPSNRTLFIYRRQFPDADLNVLARYPMINSGVFAAKATSPLWAKWLDVLEEVRRRSAGKTDAYYSDQIPLHWLIFKRRITIAVLPAVDNWQLYTMPPRIDLVRRRLVAAVPPYDDIRIMHLSGATKQIAYRHKDWGRDVSFRYREIKAFFAELEQVGSTRGRRLEW
ncbi:MAG: hypothetical protein ACHP84_21050 [Caulobacterales bacterium]